MHLVKHGVEVLDEIGRSASIGDTDSAIAWIAKRKHHSEEIGKLKHGAHGGEKAQARSVEDVKESKDAEREVQKLGALLQNGQLDENKTFSPQIMDKINAVYQATLQPALGSWMRRESKVWIDAWLKYKTKLLKDLPVWWTEIGCFPDRERLEVAKSRLRLAFSRSDRPVLPLVTNMVILDMAKVMLKQSSALDEVCTEFILIVALSPAARVESVPLAHLNASMSCSHPTIRRTPVESVPPYCCFDYPYVLNN